MVQLAQWVLTVVRMLLALRVLLVLLVGELWQAVPEILPTA